MFLENPVCGTDDTQEHPTQSALFTQNVTLALEPPSTLVGQLSDATAYVRLG